MTYIDKSRNNRSKNITISIIVILVLFISIIYLFLPNLIPSMLNSVATPFWRLEFSISSGSLKNINQLLVENESLKRQINEISSSLELVEYTNLENSELKDMLNMASSTSFTVVPVIKRPPFSPSDILIIDGGLDLGISTSSIVYIAGDIPVGKVIDVFEKTSIVKLFSSPNEKHEVEIGNSRIPAVSFGRGGGQYEVNVPKGVNITIDDFVSSAALNKPMGKVIFIDTNSTLTFEKVIFSIPKNIYQLKWVKVDLN